MESAKNFGIIDYSMLALTMLVSLGIGLYHGVKGNKTAEEFSMGGRSMTPFPVSLSLLATFISANTILGFSGEVYGYGLGLVWAIPGTMVAILFAAEVMLPVMYPLKLISPNEYLELRFHSRWLRQMSMLMAFLSIIVFMGLALYGPSLALAAVTPIPWSTHVWIMGIVVTIYASFGGLKAVVWADVFQMVMMVAGVMMVMIMAGIDAGGPQRAWAIASAGGRTDALNVDPNPHTRHTIWNVMLMMTVNWGCHYSVSHANYQRICSVPTIKQAKRILYYNVIGMALFLGMVFTMGIFIYAVYAGCDPITQKMIPIKDQIAVYYVKDKLSNLTGIPGVFVATLLSAALSSLSSGINTLATLFWADMVSHMPCFREASDFVATTVNKVITIMLGALVIGLAFLASMLGGLIEAGYTVVGVMAGPVFGVYLLGMGLPFTNKQGAVSGLLFGWGLCVWIALGSFIYSPREPLLPLNADYCPVTTDAAANITTVAATIATTTATLATETTTNIMCQAGSSDPSCVAESSQIGLLALYNVSYTLYPFIGLVACIIVGIIVSLASGYQDPKKVPGELVLPCLRRFTAKVRDPDSDDTSSPAKLSKVSTVETLVMDGLTISNPNLDETYQTRF